MEQEKVKYEQVGAADGPASFHGGGEFHPPVNGRVFLTPGLMRYPFREGGIDGRRFREIQG